MEKTKITKENIKPFHTELNSIVDEYCQMAWDSNEGGKRRSLMGELGEKISHKIFEYCITFLNIENTKVYRGGEKKIMCKIDENAYFEAQVDKHIEIDNNLRIICEAKTYLDKTYVERASSDFSIIKKYNTNDNKMDEIHKSSGQNETLKLKRNKPLKREATSTLENSLGIKRVSKPGFTF